MTDDLIPREAVFEMFRSKGYNKNDAEWWDAIAAIPSVERLGRTIPDGVRVTLVPSEEYDRLIEALEFYADEGTWEQEPIAGAWFSHAGSDLGEFARSALEGVAREVVEVAGKEVYLDKSEGVAPYYEPPAVQLSDQQVRAAARIVGKEPAPEPVAETDCPRCGGTGHRDCHDGVRLVNLKCGGCFGSGRKTEEDGR